MGTLKHETKTNTNTTPTTPTYHKQRDHETDDLIILGKYVHTNLNPNFLGPALKKRFMGSSPMGLVCAAYVCRQCNDQSRLLTCSRVRSVRVKKKQPTITSTIQPQHQPTLQQHFLESACPCLFPCSRGAARFGEHQLHYL